MFQLWQLSTQDDEHCNMKNNLNDSTFLWSIEFVNLVEKIMWSPKYQAPKIGYSATACHKNSFLFLKRAIPGLFSVYFRLFNKHTLQFLQQIYVKNVHRTFEPTTFRLRVKSHNHWTRDPAHIKTVLPDLPPPTCLPSNVSNSKTRNNNNNNNNNHDDEEKKIEAKFSRPDLREANIAVGKAKPFEPNEWTADLSCIFSTNRDLDFQRKFAFEGRINFSN